MQRQALLMYTSCGWFFDELSGLETVQVIQYAGRVVELAEKIFEAPVEAQFLEKLAQAKKEVNGRGFDVITYAADVADMADCDRFVKLLVENHGGVDVLINNAGRSIRRGIESSYDRFHDFERTMQLNYFGALRVTMGLLNTWARSSCAM